MSEEITRGRLVDFIEANQGKDIDFAKYTYKCGATDFVDQSYDFDSRINKSVWSYKFKEFYLNPYGFEFYPYFVISIPGKSYVMYELNSEITVWVCYTEEQDRGKGHMTELLMFLKRKHPDKQITVDTFNETLRKLCLNIGINLFER
ncbi:MAG: hypothetical protein OQK69_12905 [Gammaproteobacteria bacterium]|nr:hypothetical protein [Gammaproteobacteria bacterium]